MKSKSKKTKDVFFPYIPNPHYSTAILKNEVRIKEKAIDNLPREVIKWIQSLELTYSIKNIKKDFLNGFLVAQIFSRYYPKQFPMHTIENGFNSQCRKTNWMLIKKYLTGENKSSEEKNKIKEINLKKKDFEFLSVDSVESNQEILRFIIEMFESLTGRKLDIQDMGKFQTDIDNQNKSFILKDNGDIEPLKKEAEDNESKSNDVSLIQQKTIASSKFLFYLRNCL